MISKSRIIIINLLLLIVFLGSMVSEGYVDEESHKEKPNVLALNLLNPATLEDINKAVINVALDMPEEETANYLSDLALTNSILSTEITPIFEAVNGVLGATVVETEMTEGFAIPSGKFSEYINPLDTILKEHTLLVNFLKQEEAADQAVSEISLEDTLHKLLCDMFTVRDEMIQEYLNIRTQPDGDVVGKLYPASWGRVIEQKDGWSRIQSGDVDGWVNTEYIHIGATNIHKNIPLYAVVQADILNIRLTPEIADNVYTQGHLGEEFGVLDFEEGWVKISCDGKEGYLNYDFVTIRPDYQTAVSIAQEKELQRIEAERLEAERLEAERIEAERVRAQQEAQAQKIRQEEELRRQQEAAQEAPVATITNEPVSLSYEDIHLIASVIMLEAKNQPYEGKIAVANVILNRVKSGYWGSTVSQVVYAPNQFYGSNTGLLASFIQQGPNQECLNAVYDACAGVSVVENAIFFISLPKANVDAYTYYRVIGNHCFFRKR